MLTILIRDESALNAEWRIQEHIKRNNLIVVKEFFASEEKQKSEFKLDHLVSYLSENKKSDFKILAYRFPSWLEDEYLELFKIKQSDFFHIDFLRHKDIDEPQDSNLKIWRYIDLPKLVSLLQSHTLFFTRMDKLRENDKYEGRFVTKFMQKLSGKYYEGDTQQRAYVKSVYAESLDINEKIQIENYIDSMKSLDRANEELFKYYKYVNCWHRSEHENFAMWKIYSDVFGVGIQSTFKQLCNSINDINWSYYDLNKKVHIGIIEYIDTQKAINIIPFKTAFRKPIEYQFEKELRCLIITSNDMVEGLEPKENIKLQVDFGHLIQRIYLHPLAPDWYFDVIANLIESYGLNRSILQHSNLR